MNVTLRTNVRTGGFGTTDRKIWIVALLILVLGTAAYSNCFDNPFLFDDLHSIRDNPYVRSLAHVPRYFVDASTFTRFLPNADYRPLLQVSYAIDYAIGGYSPWIWHATNLGMHLWVAFCLFLLGRRLIGAERIADAPCSVAEGEFVSAAAAVLFAVHPYTTSCVNYISTRSSLMVAALLMPATLLYLRFLIDQRRSRYIGALILFALALLTKVEAISFIVIVAAMELLFRRPDHPTLARATQVKQWLLRLLPFALVTGLYMGLRSIAVSADFARYAAPPGVTSAQYFMTQLHAWWYYVGHLVLPVGLIADHFSYPISRSFDARVALALVAWSVVGVLCWRLRHVAPQALFLLIAFLAYLAPTSSVMPIAQTVNEHRPYLPCVGLFLPLAYALLCIVGRNVKAAMALSAVLLVVLGALTHQRNTVFASDESFWKDIVDKDPASPRAQVNYGLALLERGRLPDAEVHILEATRLEPDYVFARINLGVVLARQNRPNEARVQFDEAVRIAPTLSDPYYWRGFFLEQAGDYAAAAADLQQAVDRAAVPTRELLELTKVLLRMGRTDAARQAARRGAALDPAAFAQIMKHL